MDALRKCPVCGKVPKLLQSENNVGWFYYQCEKRCIPVIEDDYSLSKEIARLLWNAQIKLYKVRKLMA